MQVDTHQPGENVQFEIDTGSFSGGGLGPPNPIQATKASPVRKPKIAPRSSTRLEVGFCFFL